MNVLLKGLKMPRGNNFVTIHVSADGKWCGVLETELEGEAVEVSTPHGRLIDVDALEGKVEKHRNMLRISMYDRDLVLHYTDVAMAPTVIEAEE